MLDLPLRLLVPYLAGDLFSYAEDQVIRVDGQSSGGVHADAKLPLPAHEMFGRMHLQGTMASVPGTLQKVTVPATVIQEFRPVAQSLEWIRRALSVLHDP